MTNFLIKFFVKNYKDTTNPNVRLNFGIFSGIVGICCNIILSVAKFIAGILSSSIATTADAFNNLSDAGSSIVSLVGFKVAGLPADDDHPFGHGRAEYISGFIVSMVITLMGVELAKSSFNKIINPQKIEFSIISLVILSISILVKLWMFFFNKNISKKIQSATIRATSVDSLVDVIATTAVVISMLVSYFTSLNIDAYAGSLVSLFIIYTGFATAKDTLDPLLGQQPDIELVNSIQKRVLSYSGIVGIHDLIVHNYGSNKKLISLHAEVPCTVDILDIHDTIDNIERQIKQEFGCETVIHMDPIVVDDVVTLAMRERILALTKLIDNSIDIHDFRMVEGKTHTNLIFDVVVPYKFRLTDSEIIEAIANAVKILDGTYKVIITVDKAYGITIK